MNTDFPSGDELNPPNEELLDDAETDDPFSPSDDNEDEDVDAELTLPSPHTNMSLQSFLNPHSDFHHLPTDFLSQLEESTSDVEEQNNGGEDNVPPFDEQKSDDDDDDISGRSSSPAATVATIQNPPPPSSNIITSRNNPRIPPALVYLLFLMKNFNVPFSAMPHFVNFAHLASKTKFDFSSRTSFRALVERIKKVQSEQKSYHNTFKTETLTFPPLPPAPVHHFPFLENVKRLLGNKDLLSPPNNITGVGGLWRYDQHSRVYSELNTGTWWQKTERDLLLRLRRNNIPTENHYLCPIILFIDGTHHDRNGRLQSEPVLCSLGNLPLASRLRSDGWFFLGILPNDSLSSAERKDTSVKAQMKTQSVKLYHTSLSVILRELILLQQKDKLDHLGTSVNVHGLGEVQLHFELAYVIGDTSGHDLLCCHYKCYSKPIKRPIRCCDVKHEELANPHVVCKSIDSNKMYDAIRKCIDNISRRRKMGKYREMASMYSQYLHIPVFADISMGTTVDNIFGGSPFEVLHALLLGLIKKSVTLIFNYTKMDNTKSPPTKSKCVNEKELEKRVRYLSQFSKRQSDREMPRTVFNTGVTKLSGIQGQEYIGLSILLIVALPGLLPTRDIEKSVCHLLWDGVTLYEDLSRKSIGKVYNNQTLPKRIISYLEQYVSLFDDQALIHSAIGLKITKFHAMLHFHKQNKRFGAPDNYNGLYLERSLKEFVKRPGRRTRKNHQNFTLDLVNTWSRFSMFDEYISENKIIDMIDSLNTTTTDSNHTISDGIDDSGSLPASVASSFFGRTKHANIYFPSKETSEHQRRNTTNNSPPLRQFDYQPQECIVMSNVAFDFLRLPSSHSTNVRRSYWATKESSGEMHHNICHPYFRDIPDCVSTALERFLKNEVPTNVNKVSVRYEVRMRSNSKKRKYDIIRCHPSYRKTPWFDWIDVNYAHTVRGEEVVARVPSRLYMFLSYELGETIDELDNRFPMQHLFCLVHSFSNYRTPSYRYMKYFQSDKMYDDAKVVSFDDSVHSVSFVLPGVDTTHHLPKEWTIKEKCEDNKFFIHIPSRESWFRLNGTYDEYPDETYDEGGQNPVEDGEDV